MRFERFTNNIIWNTKKSQTKRTSTTNNQRYRMTYLRTSLQWFKLDTDDILFSINVKVPLKDRLNFKRKKNQQTSSIYLRPVLQLTTESGHGNGNDIL